VQAELRRILETEAEVRGRLEEAQKEAAAIVERAAVESRRLVAEARQRRAEVAQAVEDRLLEEAREQVRQLAVEMRQRADKLRERAEPRMAGAVHRVVQAMLLRGDDER
jgi:hypothetical protein